MRLMEVNFYKQIFACYGKIKNLDATPVVEKRKKLIDKVKIAIQKRDIEYQEVYSVVHEIRLFDYLRQKNIGIMMHTDISAGPDFECDFGYIECVSITKGEGENKNVFEQIMKGRNNRYKAGGLRIASVLCDKKQKFMNYITDKKICNKKPCIIAVSTSILSNEVHHELSSTLMKKLLFGIDVQVICFKKEGVKTSETEDFYLYNPSVSKNGKEFVTGYFWNDDFKDISAVILNHNAFTEDINDEYFEIYLNPNANVPIDIQSIQEFKYFYLKSKNTKEILFDWNNPKKEKTNELNA